MLLTTLSRSVRRQPARQLLSRLYLSTVAEHPPSRRPWYVEGSKSQGVPKTAAKPATQQHAHLTPLNPPPADAPEYLQTLFTQLQSSPFLDLTCTRLTTPVDKPLSPPSPFSRPKGRRKRGGSDHGPGVGSEPVGQLWSWVLLLQVKEGTEGRGAVEHIAKIARNILIANSSGRTVPAKGTTRSRGTDDGWAMLDLGDHAIHVISKSAREKWFSDYYPELAHESSEDSPRPSYIF